MDAEQKVAVLKAVERNSIVQILRVIAVNCDRAETPQVATACKLSFRCPAAFCRMCGLNETFFRKRIRNFKTPHNRGQINAGRCSPANQFCDAPFQRLSTLLRIARNFDHDLLSRLCAERIFFRNDDISREVRIVRDYNATVIFASVIAHEAAHAARQNLKDTPLAPRKLLSARNQNAHSIALQCSSGLIAGNKNIMFFPRDAHKAEPFCIRRKNSLFFFFFRYSVLSILRNASSSLPHQRIEYLFQILSLGLRHIQKHCNFPETHGLIHGIFH